MKRSPSAYHFSRYWTFYLYFGLLVLLAVNMD
jgi:hypothetical protein